MTAMRTRSDIIDDFLARSGWQGARRSPLAGDASFRRYERVTGQGRQAVLMDAPPEKEDLRPFIQVGGYLQERDLSAPEIYAADQTHGLLLLEDLGDDLFTRLLVKSPQHEEALYLAAADVLVDLYEHAAKTDCAGFPHYDDARLLAESGLLGEWFLPAVMGKAQAVEPARQFSVLWKELLLALPRLRPVLALRDYHADNLLWLPERKGLKRVGLLDFQDGVIGSPAYDLVSFLEDARRDVRESTRESVLAHYLRHTRIPEKEFATAYALLGAQRNCKIIGIFVRLAVRDGKRQYLSYLPRVWGHLERDLKHPQLRPLAEWMDAAVSREWRGVIDAGDAKTQATA
jgi:aminoglycoside/choline kinase family phosphotransferase